MLLASATALNVEPARCAMIGDSAGDLRAAKRAGFGAAILVGPPEVVAKHADLADFWVDRLAALIQPDLSHL